MEPWYKNKFGWGGIILIVILNIMGILTFFPVLQSFGALLLVGIFPLALIILIPLLIGGWFFGILAEKIFNTFR